MAENRAHPDEALLIDFLLGRCRESQARDLRRRIEQEESLARLYEDLRNTFAALDLLGEHEPPETLVAQTLARIRTARQTDALLAREQLSRRDVIRPTFSLRELGAVAGIVLLMVSIFGVSWREAKRRRDISGCAGQLGRLGAHLQRYAHNHDKRLPATGVALRRWLPTANQPAVSNSTALFRLVTIDYAKPRMFQCPAVGGGSFVVQAGMTNFPNARCISYSYQYSLGPRGLWTEDPNLAEVKDEFVILADSTPVFANGTFRPDRVRAPVSDNHDGLGQNVLYLDLHVDFKRRPSVGVMGDNIYLVQGVFEYDGDEAPAGPTDTFLPPSFTESGPAAGQQQLPPPHDRD